MIKIECVAEYIYNNNINNIDKHDLSYIIGLNLKVKYISIYNGNQNIIKLQNIIQFNRMINVNLIMQNNEIIGYYNTDSNEIYNKKSNLIEYLKSKITFFNFKPNKIDINNKDINVFFTSLN